MRLSAMAPEPTVDIWACPVCQSVLQRGDKFWHCDSNHRFDIAKEGYTNLLLANQKRSSNPGDTKAMMANRRAFLSAGHYQPLANKIIELLGQLLKPQARLLDLGCGEGYYLQQLQSARPDLRLQGVDISRDAVKLASRQLKQSYFAVASSFNLPVPDSTLDAMLRVFAPSDAREIQRVLKPDAILVVVSPGPRHLYDLKRVIYKEPKEHAPPPCPEGFYLVHQHRVEYPLSVESREGVQQLLAMTPFFWKGQREAKEGLSQASALSTAVDFDIRVYRPGNDQFDKLSGH